MARILTSNFASVFTVEIFKTIPGDLNPGGTSRRLDTNKSTRPNNLSPRLLLQELKQQILHPLSNIFNRSVQLNKVSEDWMMAHVTPIKKKKGDKSVALNHKQIILISVAGKILQMIIRDKLVVFLEDKNIIADTLHGFRNKRSRLTNLLDFLQGIYKNWDDHLPSDVIYLDFEEVSDKVSHERLLKKLHMADIGSNLIAWMSDWLTDRKQRVLLNG